MSELPPPRSHLPEQGLPHQEVLRQMESLRSEDARWRQGRTFSLVYHAGDEHRALLQQAYCLFFDENALNPTAFRSLLRMENEVVAMAASLLGGGPEACGTMSSGGTESILLAVKTYRDWARAQRPDLVEPEMVLPVSAHPAFDKAAHYLGVRAVHVPLGPDLRVDVDAVRAAITPRTILLVGSAPAYPHGVIDPIPALAALAQERGLGMHVDACLGGFLLPFVRELGHPVPPFDLSVPGVTSLSADLHKYGFAAKGASVVLYRNRALRRYQFFVTSDWPGGLFGSPTLAGTRPGGAIAAAWAALMSTGRQGYLRRAEQIMRTSRAFLEGIAAIPGLRVLGQPDMSVFAFTSDEVDILAVADALAARGWHVDRQQHPSAIHLMITPAHQGVEQAYLADLRAAVEEVRAHPERSGQGQAAAYGLMARLPDRGAVRELILQYLDDLYSLRGALGGLSSETP
ncbi:MAG: aspartate aminotransferase family protein [Myxococcales bacterium]|nr:aspartate aminotransferase family protein [Myxococcales bacterium]